MRISSIVSSRFKLSATLRFARITPVLPAAASSKSIVLLPCVASAKPLSLSTSAAATKPQYLLNSLKKL